uniref:Carboxylesterase type B domain-containing protein n=1 Tax=Graphocephala atropunctata TaxID=36148 RepID=A0A1B6M1L7_9HEMI
MMFTAQEGLFRAGICNSGSALAPWALHQSSSQRRLLQLIVRHTGCPDTPEQLVQCLQELPSSQFQELLQLAKRMPSSLQERATVVGPVVEVEGVADALVTRHPWNSMTRLPLLIGANQMEGLFWLVDIEKDKTDKKFREFSLNYSTILPFNLYFDNARDPIEMAANLKKFYFNGGNIDRNHFSKLVDLFSDGLFNYDLVQSARRNEGKTYFYQMNYQGSNSIVNLLGSQSRYGVSHFDEMFHLFPVGGLLIRNETALDIVISKQLVKMWTNFIKYLDPTPRGMPVRWEPVSSSDIEYLNIGQDGFKMEKAFLKDRIDFWESLFK